MPGRASDLIKVPESLWQRPEAIAALRERDIGQLFALVHKYAGASQTQIGIACVMSQPTVSDIMRGIQQVERLAVFERIADALEMPDHARVSLGLAPHATSHLAVSAPEPARDIPAEDTPTALDANRISDLLSLDVRDGQEEEDPVRRRSFLGLAGASMFSAMLTGIAPDRSAGAGPLAPILTGHVQDTGVPAAEAAPDVAALTAAVNRARSEYQACRYSDLLKYLPDLLARLHVASLALDGDARLRVHALSADAHHVAAGLLLKLDDQGLAYLAADRSMRAAIASEDPLMVGASARIITHTLMRGGHFAAATATASNYTAQLDRATPSHTPESLSVYGSILLRGAIAAAEHDNRATAHELLDEADEAGHRLGLDGNLRGTAFGPTNARQHRVNIAVTLGDAGTAVHVARGIDLNAIKVTERKAGLLIDTARAFLQWGKHEKAYVALRAAKEVAHEEVTGRPAVHRLVRELVTTAPLTVRRDAEEFASQIGVSR
ncbi:MAG: helix-turn-helix domain-containing protein [bacterium]|jgi:transcriptional regulator with XRE-family HTH domain|nr:helix-turn-helix domain-containing protein [bacterium]